MELSNYSSVKNTGPESPAQSLLSSCSSGGCGAKIEANALASLLSALRLKDDPALIAGFGGSEDAAVYRIAENTALVSTVDFFPPMVDDPFLFGKIAAANALSDIYAMGAVPLFALNLVCFPEKMDKAVLAEILRGGAEKILEAGAVLAGGHSIYDHEIKYGLALTGIAEEGLVLRNNACKTGDALILTKALGIGLVMSAMRAGKADEAFVKKALSSMERLNRYAAEKITAMNRAAEKPVHACTDVTGFGLLAHAAEMAGDAHSIFIESGALPLLPGAVEYAEAFYTTAGAQRNRNHMAGRAETGAAAEAVTEICFDPQTSGGLLVSVDMEKAQELCDLIKADDPDAAIIGEVADRGNCPVLLL
ncbi:MAG: selenide, water dikinase SelD [Treponema sp.]|jgi:selenide,water dikinase|nr:selenide, water dikinase SelD [Treponema sp.]